MAEGSVILWGWDAAVFVYRKLVVDALGHLQVDVITAGGTASHCMGWTGAVWTPLLVESLANANLRTRLYDGVNPVVSVGTGADIADTNRGLLTQAVLRGWDGAFFKAVNVEDGAGDALANARASLATVSKLYGYNGTTWDRLRVESAVAFNLRVRLYAGANAITSITGGAPILTSHYALVVAAVMQGWGGTNIDMIHARSSFGDLATNVRVAMVSDCMLYGYNGAEWDRLRTYGTGILKVGRAEIDSTTVRVTAAGGVVAGAHNLYWISCSPDAPGAEFELTDAIAGGGAVVFDHFDPDKHSEVIHLDPPMKFATGIWVEKYDHIHSLVFCYV